MRTRRRLLITLAAAAFPITGRTQSKTRRLGLLTLTNSRQSGYLRDALQEPGIALEVRSAEGKVELLDKLAADLGRAKVELIVAHEWPAVLAAKKAVPRVPIVAAPAGDPAAMGATGVGAIGVDVAPKLLDFLRETKTNVRRVGLLADANDPFTRTFQAQLNKAAAARIRMTVGVAFVKSATQYDAAFAEWDRLQLQGVIVHSSLSRPRAIELARSYRIPAIGTSAAFVEAGGLMAYSASAQEVARRTATFVERIFKGAKAAQLAVEQPKVYELALNLKAARAMELEFPDALIARADAITQ